MSFSFAHPYSFGADYHKSVAYFSMEFAIDQSLKTYSGGLGFLAGSHMRSAYELQQNMVGIGILWKYGYYDQVRNADNTMQVLFREKMYHFLQDTGVVFDIKIFGRVVKVKAYYLPPECFGTVPVFFLTTDIPENDHDACAISHKLYDSDASLKIAQCILLGQGGCKLLDIIGLEREIYHLNEAHALSAAFYLYTKLGSKEAVREKLVFTTHTPEEAGNEKHDIFMLNDMGFFGEVSLEEVRSLTGITDNVFNHSLAALRLSKKANGVSKLHGEVSRKMWNVHEEICEIDHITNAQNADYWTDKHLFNAYKHNDKEGLAFRKKELKKPLFDTIANETGKLFVPEVLTIVWARRFAGYKRPDLLTQDIERFAALMHNEQYPVQFVWAGKPYPTDGAAVHIFNSLQYLSYKYPNMAVLTGHELALSKQLKDAADIWLNTPVVPREASGTSGMTAAMNGAINFSTYDGWICEFAKHGANSFIVPQADLHSHPDAFDRNNLFEVLEKDIIPTFYNDKAKWYNLMLTSMEDVNAFFGADRMADEYYKKMY